MRNLYQLFNKQIQTNCLNVKHLTLDTTTRNRSFLCDENNHVYSLETHDQFYQQIEYHDNYDDDIKLESPDYTDDNGYKITKLFEINTNVIGLELLTFNNELCIATENGEVMVSNLNGNGQLSDQSIPGSLPSPSPSPPNVLSYCNGGLQKMSWSPDQEIIVFITKTKKLVLMNSCYDPINEISFNNNNNNDDDDHGGGDDDNSNQFGDKQFVTVGWGKKETQFHGTEGKLAAIKKINDNLLMADGQQFNDLDDKDKITIDWRGDCEYFVLSFFNNQPNSNPNYGRLFKVYNKAGILQYTCEKSIGLQSPLCWRPSGLWIAIPQILPSENNNKNNNNNKYCIALYEKNGLRHREIELPFKWNEEKVIQLSWSGNSEILAIQTTVKNQLNGPQHQYIYLYTICNYHWYLKQCLHFRSDIRIMKWDNCFTEGNTLHVLLENGIYYFYRLDFTVNYSKGVTIEDESIVGVIDGKNVLLTNFRRNVIPPPMAAFTLTAPAPSPSASASSNPNPINSMDFLCYNQKLSINSFFTIDITNQLTFYTCKFVQTTTQSNIIKNKLDDVKCLGSFTLFSSSSSSSSSDNVIESNSNSNSDDQNTKLINAQPTTYNLQHAIWLNDQQMIIIYFQMSIGTFIELLHIDFDGQMLSNCKRLDQLKYNQHILITSITKLTANEFILGTINGGIIRIQIKMNKFFRLISKDPKTIYYNKLPENCEQIYAIKMDNNRNNVDVDVVDVVDVVDDDFKVFGLKFKQSLYLNEKKIATDVTSMYLTEKYLVFTTINELKFFNLYNNEMLTAASASPCAVASATFTTTSGSGSASASSYERRMERGGKIICCVPKDSKVIIQMPRGNLEVVQPRILSIGIIGQYLDDGQYRLAFDVLRKQRINLNLLVDHNPIKFLNEIDVFIEQTDGNWLNLFLTDLQNVDCTQTMYSYNYKDRIPVYPDEFWFENKITIVCDEICGHLIMNSDDYLRTPTTKILSILTSYVKRKRFEMALQLIWDLRQMELEQGGGGGGDVAQIAESKMNPQQSKRIRSVDALHYLLYLVDVNELYNVALGMYNFDLVLFVATKSQKDPKEYLPFLNNLKQYDENYRKYKIDSHLKRYEKSLEHIVKCDETKNDECLELIEKHNLYNRALKLLTIGSGGTSAITSSSSFSINNTTQNNRRTSFEFESKSLQVESMATDVNGGGGGGGDGIINENVSLNNESTPEQKQLLYKRIVQSYANYLRINGKFVDACLMYERSGDYHQAILTAKHILDWKKCLTLLKCSMMPEDDASQLILSFVPALQENGRHREAADLIKIYQNNYDSIVEILLNGKLYNDAIYEARLNADDLIERKIRPNLERYTFTLMVSLDGAMKEFNGYKNRLLTIRNEKELRRLAKLNEANSPNDPSLMNEHDDDLTDGFSDTSSIDSSSTSSSKFGSRGGGSSSNGSSGGRSHRSSKNRRKHERKIMSLKEGNPFEEIALIDPIYNLILKWYNQQMHINDVCKALINLEMDSDGQCLQDMFGKLLICIRNSLDEIWIPEMITAIQVPTDGTIDYALYQDEQRYAMIKPHQRFKPQLTITDWEFEVLK